MDDRGQSRSATLAALVFGLILTAFTFAAFGLADGRDPPLRTAELSIPMPSAPVSPGVIPQGRAD